MRALTHHLAAQLFQPTQGGPSHGFYFSSAPEQLVQHAPFRIEHYALLYCVAGSYRIQLDFREYHLQPGSLLVLRPGELHQQLDARPQYQAVTVAFRKDFLALQGRHGTDLLADPYFGKGNDNLLNLNAQEQELLGQLWQGLRARATGPAGGSPFKVLSSLVVALLYEAAALYARYACPRKVLLPSKAHTAERFAHLLSQHCKTQHSVRFYAEQVCVTPNYLSEILRERTGKSAKELINESLLTEAKILLSYGAQPIGTIAELLHFATVGGFVRFFKEHCGASPLQYRKQFFA